MHLRQSLSSTLDRFGYHLGRSDAARRGVLLRTHGIDLVYDVGAAIGRYGQELRRFGFAGRIVSVEPLDSAFATLASASKEDPLWEVEKLAVGSEPGTAEINIAANSDSSSLLPMLDRHLQAAPHTAVQGQQEVTVTTLDLLADRHPKGRRPFLKIDTQGFERAVLDGAEKTLPQLAGVQWDFSLVPLYESGMLYREAFDRLAANGFTLMNLEPGFRDPSSQQLLQTDGVFLRI